MIGVIDYGMGNLFSVSKALERVGVPYVVSDRPEELEKADAFILPGVGSFSDAMDNLRSTKLDQFIHRMVEEGSCSSASASACSSFSKKAPKTVLQKDLVY